MKKIIKKRTHVVCIRCDHSWNYINSKSRKPRNRIRCPRCHSSQNQYNRKLFGRFIGI